MGNSSKPVSFSDNHTPDTIRMRKTALIICLVSSFVQPFCGTGITVALPSIAKELHLDAPTVPWVVTIFLLASCIFMLPMGRLADIYGRKKMFATGWALFSVTSFIVSFSVNGLMLLTLRAFQGIAGSMFLGASVGILSSVYPREERGRVLGLSVAAYYLGSALGPAVGGVLTQHFGWRSIYLTMVPLALLMWVMIVTRLRSEWADAHGEKFDATGSLIYGVSLAAIMYGVSRLPDLLGLAPMAAGIVGLGGFWWWEGRTKSPVLNVQLFRGNLGFVLANLAALINFSASMSTAFLLSIYLQNVKGFTPQTAGLILIAQPLVQGFLSSPAGQLADRTGAHRLISSFGMGVTAVALFLFSRMGMQTPIWAVMGTLMLLGVGFAFFAPANMSVVMNSVDKKYFGVAAAVVATMRYVGQMLSSGIAAVIFATYMGRTAISLAPVSLLITSINVAFTLGCGICTAGVIVTLATGRKVTTVPGESR